MKNQSIINLVNKIYLENMLNRFSEASKSSAAIYDSAGMLITDIIYPEYKDAISEACVTLYEMAANMNKPAKIELSAQKNIEILDNLTVQCYSVPIMLGENLLGVCVYIPTELYNTADTLAEFFAGSVASMYDAALANSSLTTENKYLLSKSEHLGNSLEAMKIFTDTANVGIYAVDYHTGELIMWNNTYSEMWGIPSEEIRGKICWELMGNTERCTFCKRHKIIDESGNINPAFSWENYIPPPHDMWLKITDKALIWEDGRLVHMITFVDVSEHHALEDKLNKLAYYDSTLKMLNSISLKKEIDTYPPKTHLLVIDIEGLRKINNVYGRAFGDALLKEMRNYLYTLDVQNKYIFRLEVADFGILLTCTDDEADYAKKLASIITERCRHIWHIYTNSETADIYISINTCIVPVGNNGDTFFDLINNIEQTLDIARKNSALTFYNKDTSEVLHDKLRLELSLNSDIKDNMNGFSVLYQPIVNMGVALWSGLEVLCRWKSTEFGPMSPSVFIPLAENNGQIRAIGEWVIDNAVSDAKELGLHNIEGFFLSINLSPVQLSFDDIDKIVIRILKKYDYPPEKLGLEINGSSELTFSGVTLKTIEKLSKMGVIITMDDFGTAYSSFNTLNTIPAKILKTSKRFIEGMETDSYLQHLLRLMVDLAHVSKMKLVAMGIETKQQAVSLMNQGIDLLQGYYFSYPLTYEELEKNTDKFYKPSGEILSIGYSRLDLARLRNSEAGYFLTPKLYKLIANCMQVLFNVPDGNEAIEIALKLIGESLDVSRSYVFIEDFHRTYSNTHEWCKEDVAPKKDTLQKIDVPIHWLTRLDIDGIIMTSDISGLENELYDILSEQSVKAILVFPIWSDNRIYGFVGFDDCETHRNWTAGEVQMLHNLTGIIASVFYRVTLQNKIKEQGVVLENVLNNMNTYIYVTDLEKNEILFANSKLISAYDDPLKGNPCHKALFDYSERCPFCPLRKMEMKLGETYHWEFYNERLQRYFRVNDSIIQWTGGKLVHLEYAEDITDIKDYQSKLEIYASTDMFTQTLNRASIIGTAKAMLKKAYENGFMITIAFIDIDGLKNENDTYGHEAGDVLISNVVYSISSNIRDSDKLGRYGGDEFIVIFYNCITQNAQRRMRESLALLDRISYEKLGRSQSFSFGLVESSELPYSGDSTYIDKLINIADKRMFDQKNAKKSRQ